MFRQKLISVASLASIVCMNVLLVAVPISTAQSSEDSAVIRRDIKLLAPLGPSDTISVGNGPMESWFEYFGNSAGWLYDVAIGFCVLWTLIGGFQVMISGDDAQLRGQGFDKMKSAIMGLLMLIFAPTILRLLNNNFFV